MKNKTIKKVAILGSGIMGSRIACHFANIGVEVLLLDIAPTNLTEDEQKKGLELSSPAVKNRIVNEAFQKTVKANPAALYHKDFASRVKLGNFDDNLKEIKDYDWILEAVVENLDIKKSLYEKVETLRKAGSLVTSNTSGIPIHLMAAGRSDDFRKNFCGTHFFNPPRYLRLLEIIPTPDTDPEIVSFLMKYGDLFLGKTTVLCKDTPAFIANRIGIYSMVKSIAIATEMGLTVEEVDKLTGPAVGRPKSGTYRLSDVVGLDTTVNVGRNLYAALTHDESRDAFKVHPVIQKLYDNKWLGDKTGQGFYKKVKNDKGKSEILALDFTSFEYKPSQKVKFEALEQTKSIENLPQRIPVLLKAKDKAGEFYRKTFLDTFRYATFRIPEISDTLYAIDQAIMAGFGWEIGIFEAWDALGLSTGIELMEKEKLAPASWVYDMIKDGHSTFYKTEKGSRLCYNPASKSYEKMKGTEEFIILDTLREQKPVWKNSGTTLHDIGDGVLCLEFQTKMNTMGAEVIEGLFQSISIAEKDFRGLVIGNDSTRAFSAGANLAMLFMNAVEQEFDEISMMIAHFQKAVMRVRYSAVPIITAPHTLVMGGGCELNLHADIVVAHAETYMGLVELGVGLIPAGGGTKEMALRCSDLYQQGDPELNILSNAFMNIATAKVSTSAHELYDMNYLQPKDKIVYNRSRLISEAKNQVLKLANAGYTQPVERTNIKVQGKTGIALFMAGIEGMRLAGNISDYDAKLAQKLAYVICGGDLSSAQMVSEQYLLDLEREAFVSLCGEPKTLERIQSLLNTGKALRN